MTNSRFILVVGAGFVGLSTAVFLARKGLKVVVIDKEKEIVSRLKRGTLHFHEPVLRINLKKAIAQKNLKVDTPGREYYESADFIFIAIDSADRLNWRMDMGPFRQMARWIGSTRRSQPPVVVLKSTNVVGFAERFRKLLDCTRYGEEVGLVVNPEFLREGFAYEDTAKPWRIVIGSDNKSVANRVKKLFRKVYDNKIPIISDGWKSAELIKLASNLYLAHRLAFINEVAEFARVEGLDPGLIKQGIGSDPRIGHHYFEPGIGFGGACLPKDCRFINIPSGKNNFRFRTAETALTVNRQIIDRLVKRAAKAMGKIAGKKILILGATFKAGTDDTRESQAVTLIHRLERRRAKVAVFDPYLKSPGHGIPIVSDLKQAARGAHILIVGTAHEQFKNLRPSMLAAIVKKKQIIDYFDILRRAKWEEEGFEFV